MLRKTAIVLAAVAALSSAFAPTDAFAGWDGAWHGDWGWGRRAAGWGLGPSALGVGFYGFPDTFAGYAFAHAYAGYPHGPYDGYCYRWRRPPINQGWGSRWSRLWVC
jgi:hypothetical protein